MKKFINKILDVPKLILRIWVLLWVTLIILLIMKACFGIWYPIVVKNEFIITICNFIDGYKWLAVSVNGIFYVLSANIIYLTQTGRRKYPNIGAFLVINAIIISVFMSKVYISILGSILEIVYIVGLAIFINIRRNSFDKLWKNIVIPLVNYGLINAWQITLLFIRDSNGNLLSDLPTLIGIVVQIDYYIFIIINWIGVCFMGLWSIGWFFGKSVTELKALKEEELSKKEPDMELVAKIDEAIEKKSLNESK